MRYLLIFLIPLVFACSNGKQKEIDKVADEVMEIHDEVMPLTDDLYKMRMTLQKKLKEDTSLLQTNIPGVIQQLSDGEDAMMDWMHNFNLTYKGETDDDTYSYFVEQKKSMTAVSDQMKEALKLGEKTIYDIENN